MRYFKLTIAYDGTDSSVFAMKQFIYLFPELTNVKTTVLQAIKNEDDESDENGERKLKEFLMMHYDAIYHDTLHGDADIELFKKFIGQKNKMLVMGAYGSAPHDFSDVWHALAADLGMAGLLVPDDGGVVSAGPLDCTLALLAP